MDTLLQVSPQNSLAFPKSLTEEYQPRTIAEFVGLEKQRKMLSRLAENPRPGCLLFIGGPGTGKTSMGFAFGRAIKAETHHISSQDCKLETLQSVAATCHRYPYDFQTGTPCAWHLVLIDEADLMSPAAQTWLLSKLDNSDPCPMTIWVLTCNSVENFADRLLSRMIQLPKFNSYASGSGIRDLLTRIWRDRAGDAPLPDLARVPTGNPREALNWLEGELLSV